MSNNARVTITLLAKNATRATFDAVRTSLTRLKSAITSLQGQMAGLGLALGGAGLARYLVGVNSEYGKLLTQLQTFEGSSRGARAVFQQLSDFAAKTPFQITELVEAYVTLRTAGITPTMETMALLGDQASAMGRRINDFAVAIRAATTGEFDPLKSFGVQMHVAGDQVQATFQGVTTTIGRNARDIVGYLTGISKTNFAGGMERESRTLGGALSNLQDAAEALARAIGDAGLTADMGDLARALTGVTEKAGDGASQLRYYYQSVTAWGQVLLGFAKILTYAIATPIVTVAAVVGTTIRTIVGLVSGSLILIGATIDAFTAGRTNYAKRLATFSGGQFRQAFVRNPKALGAAVGGLGSALGETAANVTLAADLSPDGMGGVTASRGGGTKGGLKATGAADAPAGSTAPGGALEKANKKAEKERADRHKAFLDDLTERAALVQEQIDLGMDLEHNLREALSLENALLNASKRQADPGDAVKLLRARSSLQKQRADSGFLGVGEKGSALDQITTNVARAQLDAMGNTFHQADTEGVDQQLGKDVRGIVGSSTPGYLTGLNAQLDALGKHGLEGTNQAMLTLGRGLKNAVGEGARLDEVVGHMTANTFQAFGNAVEDAFAALVDGSKSAGEAFAAAMLGALGQVASGFGQFFLAKATTELGEGIAAASNPITAFEAAGHFKAAGLYTAGAMAMFALGGALKGAAAGGGGGARGAASSSGSALSQASKGEAVFIIENGLLDLTNPEVERRFVEALNSVEGRRVTMKKG